MLDKSRIRIVGFDLDETLYPSSPAINNQIRGHLAASILNKNPALGNLDGARQYFERSYSELQSGRKVLIQAGYSESDASRLADEAVSCTDITGLLIPDQLLARRLRRIGENYPLYLLTSSPEKKALEKLDALQIPVNLFRTRIYGDTRGENQAELNKQDGLAFDYAIKITRIPATNHLYVGNSRKSDILPAKKLGMQTIGVWSNIPEADLSIDSIHSIEEAIYERS